MSEKLKFASKRRSIYSATFLDRPLSFVSRYNAVTLIFIVCCAVAVIGVFVVRDMQAANAEAREMYTRSVHGLRQIGELQYDAQETRRATLYALTTSDSNLQVEYADQSRAADRRVKDGIVEYSHQAKDQAELAVASRLAQDWENYLGVRDEVLASILEGSTREGVNLDLSKGVPAFELVRKDLNEIKRLYDQDAARRQSNLVASSRRSLSKLVGILSFTFLLSGAAVWAIQRSRMLTTIQLAKLQIEFVASVSHEMRTPLAVISSAADNLADGLVDGKAALQKYGAIIRHQSRNMSELVNQILLFASTEDRENRYTLEALEIAPLIDSILVGSEAVIREAGFSIDCQIEPNLPLATGDVSGVSQCLHNLIGNAVKYGGDDRRILLRAFSAKEEHVGGREIRISVSDHGIGIDSSELAHIFDPFYRSPRVHAAQIHGTGLGLSLAKRIAESMGGRLSVVSELSVGSTFTLHLRIFEGKEMERAASISHQPSSSRL